MFRKPMKMTRRPMRTSGMAGAITPQAKNIHVNKQLGNSGMQYMQGTSFEVFDEVDISTPSSELNFFINSNAKQLPFTNLRDNRLKAGESLVVEYMYFAVRNYVAGSPEQTNTFDTPDLISNFQSGVVDFTIGNQRVIKDLSVLTIGSPLFDIHAQFDSQYVFVMRTDITIPPEIEFSVTVRTGAPVQLADSTVRCCLGGPGSLLNTRTTY